MTTYHFKGGVELDKKGHLIDVIASLPQEQTPLNIQKAQLPKRVILSLRQCTGGYAKPIVVIGDKVKVGQVLTKFDKSSVPVHSSISGEVVAIGEDVINQESGLKEQAISIKADGKDQWVETQGCGQDFKACSPEVIINYIHQCGIIGLGGAGFPTHIKLAALTQCQTLIINGVECELGVSCDQAIMQAQPQAIAVGIEIVRHITKASRIIVAIKKDNILCWNALKDTLADDIEFALMPNKYTSGDEKIIIHSVLGVSVPSDSHSVDIGILCQNISTIKAIYDAVVEKIPLVFRVMTLTGTALSSTQNYQVRLGSILSEMPEISQALPVTNELNYIVGGLMMGHNLSSLDHALTKTSNSLFINDCPDAYVEQPCIRCGACHEVCPIGLLPQQLYWYTKSDEIDSAMDYHLSDCTTCACCTTVCPSHIPLHQYFTRAQALVHNQQKDKQQANIARERFEFRNFRLERNKTEKKIIMAKKKAEIQAKLAKDKAQKDKIQQALMRQQDKKIKNEH